MTTANNLEQFDNERKQELINDLCARLPYGVILKDSEGQILFLDGIVRCSEKDASKGYVLAHEYNVTWSYVRKVALCDIKPYLRPMDSMTEKEKEEYCDLQAKFLLSSQYPVTNAYELFDWLNEHHFDYRGLIEKGLALKATKGMYEVADKADVSTATESTNHCGNAFMDL